MRTKFFTICSANYLAYARTLAQSIANAEAGAILTVFLADEMPAGLALPETNLVIIPACDLGIEGYLDMAFRYSVLEMNTAIKPFCFEYMLDTAECDAAIYLDPDIFVLGSLDHVHDALERGAACVLTPHITDGLSDGRHPDENAYLTCGIFNLGCAAFSNAPEARSFIRWWAGKCRRDCVVAIERGIFTDQAYCDFAPCFITDFVSLRHPGYNLAYWNLPQREVSHVGEQYLVDGEPLRFFHFSGIDARDPASFSKHQNRYTRSDVGVLRPLVEHYANLLIENEAAGPHTLSQLAYAYARFRDGSRIRDPHRWVYQRYAGEVGPGIDPFMLGPDFFNAAADLGGRSLGSISRLYLAVWEARSDLQKVFDLRSETGIEGFRKWAATSLARDHDIEAVNILPGEAVESWLAQPLESDRSAQNVAYDPPALASEGETPVKEAPRAVSPTTLLDRALTSRSFMVRNLVRRYLFGQERTRDYWARRLVESPVQNAIAPLPSGLDVYGYLKSETGVGQAARGFVDAIGQTDIAFNCHLLPTHNLFADIIPFDHKGSNERYDTALICANADVMAGPLDLIEPEALQGCRRIAHWAWELPVFPAAWAPAFQRVDEIWVASRFVARAVGAATDKPVRVVPYVVRTPALDRSKARQAHGLEDDRYIFLTAFDLNSFIARKNPCAAIEAFRAAFHPKDSRSPLLIVKYHGHGTDARARIAEAVGDDDRIKVIDSVFTPAQMASLRSAADALVSLHRSEGFGLNIAEAMAAGKLVVATNFSGNADFMNEANSIPIPYRMTAVGPGEYPRGTGQWWADPDADASIEAMRWAADHPTEAAQLGATARQDMETNYSPSAVAAVMSAAMKGRSVIEFA